MSLYDFTNQETEKLSSVKENKKPSYNHRPSTSIDFQNLDPENNPLNRRRLLSGSKQFEIDKIKSSLIEKNMRINNLRSKFYTPDIPDTGDLRMPIPGSGLVEKIEKKKK